MLGTTRNSTSTPNNSLLSGRITGFTPRPATATDLVEGIFLGRLSSTRDSILQKDGQGRTQNRVLLNLVGVRLPELDAQGNPILDGEGNPVMVTYPDPTGKTKLPPVGSEAFKRVMDRRTGIKVTSIYKSGQEKIRSLILSGDLSDITEADLDGAIAKGNVNLLMSTKGAYLRSLSFEDGKGVYETHELTVREVCMADMTFSITFFGGEDEAFAEGYEQLQKLFTFQNVAMVASISPNVEVSQLGENISYQADEVHFHYAVSDVGGRSKYLLDPKWAKSGRPYSTQSVNGATMVDVARQSKKSNYDRNNAAIEQGRANRQFANDTVARAMIGGGIKVPAGKVDTGDL